MFKFPKRIGPAAPSSTVDAFIDKARQTPARLDQGGAGRLIFALDATLSRQPTWDLAVGLQHRMFETAASHGGLAVQLVYFRGLSECRASPFVEGGAGLARYMRSITVSGGLTQIGRVLTHTRDEARKLRVGALVFVGDSLEEPAGALRETAGELALLGVKAFMFQEGQNPLVASVFRDIARITGGVYAAFDANAPDLLASLLAAAAAYAAGGRRGLEALAVRDHDAVRLLAQMT